jgi:hypothetical protein
LLNGEALGLNAEADGFQEGDCVIDLIVKAPNLNGASGEVIAGNARWDLVHQGWM